MDWQNILKASRNELKEYFDLTPYLIPQDEAEAAIRDGISFRGTNILILIVAIFIASLGLNTNSTAVIIGAMLISPLMGPIIGIGLAVGVRDFELMKRSFRNLMMATAFSVATSCLYFLISPVNEGHSELLARTSPTIYDVFIGFFGGAAGILATGSKSKGNILPGVAIATALMPPLCTVGYGLATWQPTYFLGALYLFFINSVFIACATTLGVWAMKYAPKAFSNPAHALKVKRIVFAIAILTMIPAGYLTYTMYIENRFRQNCEQFVSTVFDFPDTQVLSQRAHWDKKSPSLTVALIGRSLPQDSLLVAAEGRLSEFHLQGTHLRIIQGQSSPNAISADHLAEASSTMLRDMYTATQATITRQQSVIDSLRMELNQALPGVDTTSLVLAPEVKVLFPAIKTFSLATTVECSPSTGTSDTVDVALYDTRSNFPDKERERFAQYLQARLRLRTTPRLIKL